MLSNHHAILDGWSLPVILNSVHESYLQLNKGQQPELIPDTAYTDTQKYLQESKEISSSFWKNYMSQIEDQEDLANLLKESQRHTDLGIYKHIKDHQDVEFLIEGEQYQQLKEFTQTNGFTVNAVLQYLWHNQLKIYSNSEVTVVGTTISGRNLPVDGIESSAGLYINTLPLIVTHEEGKVKDLILKIQENISELNSHSDVNLANLQHDGRRIFSSLFVYENYPVPHGENNNELGFVFRDAVERLDYPLGVTAFERDEKVSLMLSYEGHLFENRMMNQLLEGMKIILNQLLENPEITSEHLSYITSEDHKKITLDWNNTWTDFPTGKTIQSMFDDQAAKTPDRTALVYQDITLSYKELNERANRLANYLNDTYDLQPDDLVPLCLERSENMLIAILAVLKSGAAYVPMDPTYPSDRIEHILQDTQAKIVITQKSTGAKFNEIQSEKTEILLLDDENLIENLENSSIENPVTRTQADDLAYVIYTSGTTGMPKGVMIEHTGVINLVSDLYARYNLNESKSFFSLPTMYLMLR